MSDYKLSIIVAVYNMEKYLEKNIESLLNQDLTEVQYVYVDDGSTDGSSAIIEKYAQKDSRILLIHKTNGGLSDARNYGMRYAEGEYILFVDSDDYVEPNVLGKMYAAAKENNLDVLRSRLQHVETYGIRQSDFVKKPNVVMSGRDRLLLGDVSYTICVHMYRRGFLVDHKLEFLVGVYHEDMDFIVRSFAFARATMDLDLIFYNYVVREGSISHSGTIKRSLDYYTVARHVNEFAYQLNDNELYEGYFREYLAFMYSHVINICVDNGLNINEVMDDKERQKDILVHLKNSKQRKYQLQYLFLKCHMYKLYSRLYKMKK